MEIQEIIEGLKKLDLATYPKAEILSLLGQVGKVAYVVVSYHKGKSVMRARPNYNGERFETKDDYSFKPPHRNHTYQRASTPSQTMFYATAVPDNPAPGELDNMRVIGISETIPMLRDKTSSGVQKISFGRWYVHETINLIGIIQKDKYAEASSYTREMAEGYQNFINQTPPEILNSSQAFASFLADEFSKEEIRGDFDYMISAIFTQLITQWGFDGVFYPSVRVGGMGFNIAVTPEATKKMALYVAGECTVYKLKDHIIMDNNAIVQLKGTENDFKLTELGNHEMDCLQQLSVSSVNDLK